MSIKILGISAYYHDSAAALIIDGDISFAAQEERFTRKKHDASFPSNAIKYCLEEAELYLSDLDYIVFYDKPLIKFERLIETYLSYSPKGFKSFITAMPVWIKEKLFLKRTLKMELRKLSNKEVKELPKLLFLEHHESHAASAFFPSPFKKSIVLCLDGVGEWATSSVWLGDRNSLLPKWQIDFPHSLGLLYSAFTYYTGFKVNSGEYKLMGLAPYGEPKYKNLILENLLDLKADGTFRLDMSYFNYATGLSMTNKKFHRLFGGPPRKPESMITQKDMDIASSIQLVTEEIILRLVRALHKEFNTEYLCLAGGVALNCVANGRILREGPFKDIWIQPAAGDAGGAIGAALGVWFNYLENPRDIIDKNDGMHGTYLGKCFSNDQIKFYLDNIGAKYYELDDYRLMPKLSDYLSEGKVIGWFSGRMEFGPRALGSRSILGDPRNVKMQSKMNLKIKYRESFRPFAPAIMAEFASQWFDLDRKSPYMQIVTHIKNEKRLKKSVEEDKLSGIDRVKISRSKLPAITHVDYSARIQTVHQETNGRFYDLLRHFYNKTECPVLINTSFNIRGEPIVSCPEDAYRCFMHTDMDFLVMENILLRKTDQTTKKDYSLVDKPKLD